MSASETRLGLVLPLAVLAACTGSTDDARTPEERQIAAVRGTAENGPPVLGDITPVPDGACEPPAGDGWSPLQLFEIRVRWAATNVVDDPLPLAAGDVFRAFNYHAADHHVVVTDFPHRYVVPRTLLENDAGYSCPPGPSWLFGSGVPAGVLSDDQVAAAFDDLGPWTLQVVHTSDLTTAESPP